MTNKQPLNSVSSPSLRRFNESTNLLPNSSDSSLPREQSKPSILPQSQKSPIKLPIPLINSSTSTSQEAGPNRSLLPQNEDSGSNEGSKSVKITIESPRTTPRGLSGSKFGLQDNQNRTEKTGPGLDRRTSQRLRTPSFDQGINEEQFYKRFNFNLETADYGSSSKRYQRMKYRTLRFVTTSSSSSTSLLVPKTSISAGELISEDSSPKSHEAESFRSKRDWGKFLHQLKRSNSLPYLYSWEYGNIDVDLQVPGIGSVNEYLQKVWQKKRELELEKQNRIRRSLTRPRRESTDSNALLPELTESLKTTPKVNVVASDTQQNESQDLVYNDLVEKLIYAGTKTRLLRALADDNTQDKEYIEIFLATHTHFMTSVELFETLQEFFYNPLTTKVGLSPSEANNYKLAIQMRVVNVFKKWVRLHPYDFENDPMKSKFEEFLKKLENSDEFGQNGKNWAAFLRSTFESAKNDENQLMNYVASSDEAPAPIVPKVTDASRLSFADIAYQELARQLTLLHFSMFLKIRPVHLYALARNKSDPSNPITTISEFSKKISAWVTTEIVCTPHIKQRTVVLGNFIRLCAKLIEMNNFHGAMDIYVGISHYTVLKLKRTWKGLERSLMEKWKYLMELFSPSSGWSNLRKRINQTQPPLIIPPSIFLHDSIAILENDDYWDDNHTLLNFHKLRLFAGVLRQINRCQIEPFVFLPIKSIQDFLTKHLLILSDQELEQEVNSVLIQESLPQNTRSPLKFFINKDKDKDKDSEKNKPQSPRLIPLNPKERKGSGSYSHFVLPPLTKSPRNTNSTEFDNSKPDEDSTKMKERSTPMKGKEEKELLKTAQNRSSEKLKTTTTTTTTTTTSQNSGESKPTKGRSNSTGLAKLWKKEKKEESKSGDVIPEDDREVSFLEFLREDPGKVLDKEKKDKKDKKEKEKKAKLFRTKSREKIERINVNKEKSSSLSLSQSGRPRNNSATDYHITNNPISQKLVERRADVRHGTTASQSQASEANGNSSQSGEYAETLPDKELKPINKPGSSSSSPRSFQSSPLSSNRSSESVLKAVAESKEEESDASNTQTEDYIPLVELVKLVQKSAVSTIPTPIASRTTPQLSSQSSTQTHAERTTISTNESSQQSPKSEKQLTRRASVGLLEKSKIRKNK